MNKIFSNFKDKLKIPFVIFCAFFIPVIVTVFCLLSFNIIIEQNISKNWETLLAAAAALLAAKWTVKKIEEQISESRRQAETQRKQNLIAAKIKMSGALSEIGEYIYQAFAYYMSCVFEIQHVIDPNSLQTKISSYQGKILPHFNDSLFTPVIDVATLTEHKENTEIIYQIFRRLQVSQVNLKEFHKPPYNEHIPFDIEKYNNIATELAEYIVPIHCIAQSLCDYFEDKNIRFQTEDSILTFPSGNRIGASFLGLTDEWKSKNNNNRDFPDSFKKIIREAFDLDNVSSLFSNPF